MPFDATSDAMERIESAWADIASIHPDIDTEVVFVVKSDKRAWGHMTLGRSWAEDLPEGCEGPRRQWREIMLSAELLAQHPARILQTMIHEAAHTMAQNRGIKDTSRQYRYHNGRFRELAEEMGLEWAHVVPESVKVPASKDRVLLLDDETGEAFDEDGFPFFEVEAAGDATIGYSAMTITAETLAVYADTLTTLDGIKVKHQAVRAGRAAPRKRSVVCLVPTGGELADPVANLDEAEEVMGYALTTDEIQRIGPVVYEGLVERKLLAGHVYWVEAV